MFPLLVFTLSIVCSVVFPIVLRSPHFVLLLFMNRMKSERWADPYLIDRDTATSLLVLVYREFMCRSMNGSKLPKIVLYTCQCSAPVGLWSDLEEDHMNTII